MTSGTHAAAAQVALPRAPERVGSRYVVVPRRPALSRPAALLVCALAYAAFSQGAFYVRELVTVTALLATAGVVAARGSGRQALGGVPAWAAGCAAWAVVSAALGGDAGAAAGPVALAACVAAAVVVVRGGERAEREAFVSAVLGVGCCVAVLGWLGVALRVVPLALVDQGLWRAASSLTYANATAGLLVPLALVCLARLADRPRDVLPRVAAAVLLTGTLATLSRAGYLALVVGLVVLAARGGTRRLVTAAAAPSVGALVAFAGLLPSMPAALPARPYVAAAALAAGLALQAVRDARTAGRVAAGSAAALVLAAAFGVGRPLADAVGRVAAVRVTAASPDRAGEWSTTWRVAREHPLTGVGPGNLEIVWPAGDGRFLRAHYTHNEYLQVLAEQGVVGLTGAAGLLVAAAAGLRRRRPRRRAATPGRTGYAGRPAATGRPAQGSRAAATPRAIHRPAATPLVIHRPAAPPAPTSTTSATSAAGASAAATGRRVRSARRARRPDDRLAAGAAAALAAFAVHSAFDFVWHVPLIPLTVLAVVAAAGPAPHREGKP